MYYIAICDDDETIIEETKELLFFNGLSGQEVTFLDFLTGEDFLAALPKMKKIDLLILDICLKEKNGEEIARIFRQYFPNTLLVFYTGVSLPTIDSFKTTPFRYMRKDSSLNDIEEDLRAIIKQMKKTKCAPFILGHSYKKNFRLSLSDIKYISIYRQRTQIHLTPSALRLLTSRSIFCEQKITELYDELKDYGFEFAHNSYIVNLNYVKTINGADLVFLDNTILTVARSKEKQLMSSYIAHLSQKY